MKALRALLIVFPLVALAGSSVAQDSEEHRFYRVELIVFTHVGGEFDAWPVDDLPALPADAHDPEWKRFNREQDDSPRDDPDGSSNADLRSVLEVAEALERLEEGQTTLTELLIYPDPWLAVDELSEPMQQALERLQNSPGHRVHHWLGWHQPLEPSRTGTVRIHDDRPLGADWIVLAPHGRPQRNGQAVTTAGQLFPQFRYRLDGTIRLRQRQFMHAEVSLYWHAPQTTGPLAVLTADPAAALSRDHLQQSRTIRPGRLEYFDSPSLGLLLRVTPWAVDGDEADGERSSAEGDSQ
ncbi:hypothetical protein G4Y73_06940 [Wenzhouxiangella sp. XN201]|uniref:CsiV family protein n=1 Tax=Wenzhouxiangella sp. XN201 TaxID=2710755 RepID=UPI0013C9061C|nr:CsiV family protein [Wenzhouxiangella sp. XN201]NEZ03884.1 hypothetical protein [Wenzhouxiangella sp. XN201]